MNVPLAKRIGAVQPQYDARKVIKKAHEAGLYTIARIVVFQDPILAAKGGKLALEKKGGGVWETSGGLGWVDPTDRRVWDYVIDVALAAADAGFDEVMFDYVRFPTDGDVDAAAYARGNASKDKTIEGFLKKASTALHARDVKVSAAIFAIQATSQAPIGQDPAVLKRVLDTISPMVYPSHFAAEQLRHPEPGRPAVRHGLRVAHRLAPQPRERQGAAAPVAAGLRPRHGLLDGAGAGPGPRGERLRHRRLPALEPRGGLQPGRPDPVAGSGSDPAPTRLSRRA